MSIVKNRTVVVTLEAVQKRFVFALEAVQNGFTRLIGGWNNRPMKNWYRRGDEAWGRSASIVMNIGADLGDCGPLFSHFLENTEFRIGIRQSRNGRGRREFNKLYFIQVDEDRNRAEEISDRKRQEKNTRETNQHTSQVKRTTFVIFTML